MRSAREVSFLLSMPNTDPDQDCPEMTCRSGSRSKVYINPPGTFLHLSSIAISYMQSEAHEAPFSSYFGTYRCCDVLEPGITGTATFEEESASGFEAPALTYNSYSQKHTSGR